MSGKTKALVWQWGRFGAGPRIAFELADALKQQANMEVLLSLSQNAELLKTPMHRANADLLVKTYDSPVQFAVSTLLIRRNLASFLQKLEQESPDVALCVMPGYWDSFLARHLSRLGVRLVTIVHDATNHPGDRFQLIHMVQKRMIRQSAAIITLSDFVAGRLRAQGLLENKLHRTIPHPALTFSDLALAAPVSPGFSRGKPLRLLLTGRLRRYKGAQLFLDSIGKIDPGRILVRIAGSINEPDLLARAQNLANVEIISGWMSEKTLVSHVDWSDALVLPYSEASQSGIIPLAYARRRPVIATPAGGLPEQVTHQASGLLASEISASAISREILRFLDDPGLLHNCANGAYEVAQNELGRAQTGQQFARFLCEAARAG